MNALYTALAALTVGQDVPDTIYVDDYADGTRPRWVVAERQELGAGGVQLALDDPDNGDMFDRVRIIVLAFPGKVLRTPPQPHGIFPAIIGDQLCDMAQQERYAAKRKER